MRLDGFGLFVDDMGKMIRFYRDVLGFEIKEDKRYCFIGGGIGVPPMLYASKMKEKPVVITGFRNKDLVILQSDFRKDNCEIYLTTDDGTAGEKAFVPPVRCAALGNSAGIIGAANLV